MMSPDIKERVRAANPIEEVAAAYTELRPDGAHRLKGLCPLHDEQSPSFTVYTDSQSFHCYGCGQGGDVFNLVELAEGIDFRGALDHLSNRTSLLVPVKGLTPLHPEGKSGTERENGRQGSAKTKPDGPPGISLKELAQAKRLPVEFLTSLGCRDANYSGAPAVRIPYFSDEGKEFAVRYRMAAIAGEGSRWQKGAKIVPYGLERLSSYRNGPVLLVEGESDCWTAWRSGIPALGIPGKSTWKSHWALLLAGLKVILWQEPGAEDLTASVHKDIHDLRVIVAPPGVKDISEAHLAGMDVAGLVGGLMDSAPTADELLARARDMGAEKLRQEAIQVLECPDPLGLIEEEIRRLGYGGDVRAPMVVYLAATSRLLGLRQGAMPVHLLLTGQPSAGKSYAVKIAARLFPDEALYVIDAGSPRTLIYDEADLRYRVIIFGEADSLPAGEDNPAASAVRNLLQDHNLHYKVVEKGPEGQYVRSIDKEGPSVLITTSVKRLGEQLTSRLFVLEVPDDQGQIRASLDSQAQLELGGQVKPSPELVAFQAYLQTRAPWDVSVPFVNSLVEAIGAHPAAARINRDFARLVSLIKAVTLVRHAQRKTHNGRLVATLDDYRAVHELIGDMFETSVSGAGHQVRETVETVAKLLADIDSAVSISRLATELGLSKQAVSGRVKRALAGGWLVNGEERLGRAFKLTLGDSLPETGGLPPPDKLVNLVSTKKDPDLQDCQAVKPVTGKAGSTSLEPELELEQVGRLSL